jgi:K+-transporting ATPase ATPase B chain
MAPEIIPSTRIWSRTILAAAIRDSFVRLAPRVQFRNHVSFGVYVGGIFTTILGVATAFGGIGDARGSLFIFAIAAWLWLSILLASFAEALA